MKRWIFNILCLLSFLLCICFLSLWVWTQSHEFSLRRRINSDKQKFLRQTDIKLVAGQLIYFDWKMPGSGFFEPSGIYESPQWSRPTPDRKPHFSWDYDLRSLSYPGGKGFQFLGARYDRSAGTRDQSFALHIPFSWLTLLSAILPILWLVRHRRRRQPNVCHNCGYDLRATPTRCPECGAIPQASPHAPRENLPLPPGNPFWKPLTIALLITIVLIFLLEWIISPPPLYREVYSSFALIW